VAVQDYAEKYPDSIYFFAEIDTSGERLKDPMPADLRPLPEDVRTHTMLTGRQPHDDGRECTYHHRLGVWTPDGLNECLREHPDPFELMKARNLI
jgi:hypothetical protein